MAGIMAGERPPSSFVSPVVVGRAESLGRLADAVADARAGRGSALFLSGEAGLGKSRLLREAVGLAAGFRHLSGATFEADRTLPYALLGDMLRSSFAQAEWTEVRAGLGLAHADIAAWLPTPGLLRLPGLEPQAEKRRLLEGVIDVLLELSARQPLLLTLEDLHWSDETSLEWLARFVRRLGKAPVLVLATYRSNEASPALGRLLNMWQRESRVQDLPLSPLRPLEVDALVRAIFGSERPLRRDFLEALAALTGGNPFFVEEVLKALVASGDVFWTARGWDRKALTELRIPPSLEAAVTGRLAELDREAQDFVAVASVVGQRFDVTLLLRLSGHTEAEGLQLLKTLVTAGLVVEISADTFAFRHALTRAAVYGSLLARERVVLHRRVAEVLLSGNLEGEGRAGELALHLLAAYDWQAAATWSTQAAREAERQSAPQAVAEHLTRAFAALEALGQIPAAASYRSRAAALATLGDFEGARADLLLALELTRAAADAHAEWEVLIGLGRLWAAQDYDRSGAYFAEALALARTLGDAGKLAHSLNRMGSWWLNGDEPLRALADHHAALEVFESLDNPRAVAETCDLLGVAHALSDDQVVSLRAFERAVATFRKLGDRRGWASCQINLAEVRGPWFLFLTMAAPEADLERAALEATEALELTREIGWRVGEAWALLNCAGPPLLRGDYGAALSLLNESLDLAEVLGDRQREILAHLVLSSLWLDGLEAEGAAQHAERALVLARKLGSKLYERYALYLLVWAKRVGGAVDEAETLLGEGWDVGQGTSLGERLLLSARAELALARHDARTALEITEHLVATAPNGPAVIPHLWGLRAETLVALGRLGETETVWDEALETARHAGRKPLEWRFRASLASLYSRQKRYGESERQAEAARRLVAACAASLPDPAQGRAFEARVERAFPVLKTRLRRGLTPREQVVAELVAQGLRDKAIARELSIGERTVETHVGNILGKLGFKTRVQIAAWVRARET